MHIELKSADFRSHGNWGMRVYNLVCKLHA